MADLRKWAAGESEQVDVLVSNATLQWVPDHLELLPRLVERVTPGGWFAFQVPGNFEEPSHTIRRELAAQEPYAAHTDGVAVPDSHDPATYLEALAAAGCTVDAWETTYLHVLTGDDPVWMLTGPIRATHRALEKTGLSVDDIDLFECNEAFASVVLAWMKETGVPHDKVNVNGGGIAIGHPIGATGTRIMATLLNELERTGGRYGLQTMCEGGGQANVTIIERL